jgi:hypothetical protein
MAGEQRPLAGAIQTVVGALIVVVTLAIYVPVAPLFPSINLDGGWAFALNVAVERGLVFGRDLVFTFGPYGAAYTQLYYPATDTMMLASTALLGTAFAFGLLCISQGWRERLGALLLVLLMAAIARDSLFFALPFMLLLLTCRVAMRQGKSGGGPERIEVTPFVCLSLALLVVALSLIPLVKGTFAGATGMVMALSCVLLLLRGHKALAMAGAVLFAVSMPLLWVLVGQPLAALPEFFISQAPIVSGYTDAMSSPGGLLLPAFFILSSLTLVALHARARPGPCHADFGHHRPALHCLQRRVRSSRLSYLDVGRHDRHRGIPACAGASRRARQDRGSSGAGVLGGSRHVRNQHKPPGASHPNQNAGCRSGQHADGAPGKRRHTDASLY